MGIPAVCLNPRCRKLITFMDSSAGTTVPCPRRCGWRITVPTRLHFSATSLPAAARPDGGVASAVQTPPTPNRHSVWRKVVRLARYVLLTVIFLKKWGAFG